VAEGRSSSRPFASPRRRAGLALVGALALVAAAIAFRSWRPPRESEAASTVPAFPSPAASSAPPRPATAPPPVAERETHASPEASRTAPRPSTPRPDPTTTPSPGQAGPPQTRAPVPTSQPLPATAEAPAETAAVGTLLLLIVPESDVTIDGRSIGSVSNQEIALPAGPHAILIVHPDYKPLPRKVTILPGVSTRVVVDLNEKGIRKQQ
jgi:hypothetical protein